MIILFFFFAISIYLQTFITQKNTVTRHLFSMSGGEIKEIIKKENVKSTKTKKQINLGLKKKVKIEKSKYKKPWFH